MGRNLLRRSAMGISGREGYLVESLAFVAALTLGLTFVVSGSSKLRDLQSVALGVLEDDVLPRPLAIGLRASAALRANGVRRPVARLIQLVRRNFDG